MSQKPVKVNPFSLEAEKGVLGLLLLQQKLWEEIEGHLVSSDFYDKKHAMIYNSMVALVKRDMAIDMLTVADYLTSMDQINQVGGQTYVYQLAEHAPYSVNIKEYVAIIRDHALKRQLLDATTGIIQSIHQPDGRQAQELVEQAESKVFSINQDRAAQDSIESIDIILARTTEKIDKLFNTNEPMSGIPTGYQDLDKLTSGLHPGDMFVIAARPSMGKTMFSANICEYVALSTKEPVLFFSLEMPSDAIVLRMLSSLGRIKQERLRTGKLQDDDWPRMTSAIGMLSETKVFIDDTPGISPQQMRAKVRRLVREHGSLKLIVVDYLQLMRVPEFRDNRVQEISEISRSLKMIAKEFNCTVIALSQLNRSLESRQDRRPMMSDLRESGAIEQDADVIAFVYRDEVYNPDSPDKGSAEIIIGKHRNGPIGTIKLTFVGEFMRFDNYADEMVIGGQF
ncbi:MAG: replicative DNA helicase [Pseudomonadota bacterium]|nr:replicative DNA helicase [Pseudomonadota bacterium]